jgi:hypothetical protein
VTAAPACHSPKVRYPPWDAIVSLLNCLICCRLLEIHCCLSALHHALLTCTGGRVAAARLVSLAKLPQHDGRSAKATSSPPEEGCAEARMRARASAVRPCIKLLQARKRLTGDRFNSPLHAPVPSCRLLFTCAGGAISITLMPCTLSLAGLHEMKVCSARYQTSGMSWLAGYGGLLCKVSDK